MSKDWHDVPDPWEGLPMSYECCGRSAPDKWHERLIVCPRFLVVFLVVVAIGVGALLLTSCSVSIKSEPMGADSARAACNDWQTVVAKITGPGEELDTNALDQAVVEARQAADDNGRYTELWRTLDTYQVIVTSGDIVPATYSTDGGTHACSTI